MRSPCGGRSRRSGAGSLSLAFRGSAKARRKPSAHKSCFPSLAAQQDVRFALKAMKCCVRAKCQTGLHRRVQDPRIQTQQPAPREDVRFALDSSLGRSSGCWSLPYFEIPTLEQPLVSPSIAISFGSRCSRTFSTASPAARDLRLEARTAALTIFSLRGLARAGLVFFRYSPDARTARIETRC